MGQMVHTWTNNMEMQAKGLFTSFFSLSCGMFPTLVKRTKCRATCNLSQNQVQTDMNLNVLFFV